MDRDALRRLLRKVRTGATGVEQALDELRHLPFENLGFATLDHHRALRRGYPEVVYGQGKTGDQVAAIVDRLARTGQTVLVTRVGADVHALVAERQPAATYHPVARCIVLSQGRRSKPRPAT